MNGVLAGKTVDNSRYSNLYQIFEENYSTCSKQSQKSLQEINGNEYTYGDLKEKVEQLCHQFHRIGLKKGDRVGLFAANGLERIATILSLAKLGVVFIPFDPVLQRNKVQQLLSQCSPMFVLIGTEHDYVSLWDTYGVNVETCPLNTVQMLPTKEDNTSLPQVLSDDLFCILFTSGSTGASKGVMLTHKNFINQFIGYWSEGPYQSDDIFLSKTNVLFVDYMVEMLLPVLKCIPCVFMQQYHCQEIHSFIRCLHEYKVTRFYIVPSLLKPLVMFSDDFQLHLRHLTCGGEALPNDLADAFAKKFPSAKLCNVYGTTELPDALAATFATERMSPDNNSIIGFPNNNTIVYVVNDDGSLVTTVGQQGELWVSGDCVSVGYIDAEQTKAVYIKNPFTEDQQFATIYKTGDYIKLTTYGVEYLGRRDNFIKVRGHKVNLGDIEHVIREILPSSQISVLSKFDDSIGLSVIYAFIVPQSMSEDELTNLLMDRLPHYMLPRIIFLDEMPLTPTSGKIDRQFLLQNIPKATNLDITKNKPTTDIEKIRHATSKVLHIPLNKVDESKSFFQMGGDSITFFLMLGELKKLGMELNLENTMKDQSLKDIANNSNIESSTNANLKVISFSEITDDEAIEIADMFFETFKTGDAIVYHLKNKFDFEPIFRGIVEKCKRYCPKYGVAVKLEEKVIAAFVNEPIDIIVDEEFPTLPEAQEELFNHCTKDVIEKLLSENHNIMINLLAVVDQNAPSEVGTEALLLLSHASTAIGKANGHTVSVTIDTNKVTQMLDLDVHKHTLAKTVHPSEYSFRGEYPFAEMDSDYQMMTVVEYLNEEI